LELETWRLYVLRRRTVCIRQVRRSIERSHTPTGSLFYFRRASQTTDRRRRRRRPEVWLGQTGGRRWRAVVASVGAVNAREGRRAAAALIINLWRAYRRRPSHQSPARSDVRNRMIATERTSREASCTVVSCSCCHAEVAAAEAAPRLVAL